jgi:hypothetical protein
MATNLKIGGKTFVCVKLSEANFTDIAAVYVILCVDENGQWTVLDIGQSGQVGSRIDDHDRKDCWRRNCASNNIWVCVYSMPLPQNTKQDREKIEAMLRSQYNPPCGKR